MIVMLAQYVNPDGTTPVTVLAYDIRENRIFFTGDLNEYNSHADFPASKVVRLESVSAGYAY